MRDTRARTDDFVRPTLPDGILRAGDRANHGLSRQQIHRHTVEGRLLHLGRGIYMRRDATVTENHTLAQVCARVPHGVICLSSALQFHGITTQSPWQVWVMIGPHARTPKLDYPPLRIVRSCDIATGVERRQIEGVTVSITNVARTTVDCFKYRNKVGIDVALEALNEFLRERRSETGLLHRYAGICRVERVMQPYVQALAR